MGRRIRRVAGGKHSTKRLECVEQEPDDGVWLTSSFILFNEYCSVRMMCAGCWAERASFDEWPCSECSIRRPSGYSTTPRKSNENGR